MTNLKVQDGKGGVVRVFLVNNLVDNLFDDLVCCFVFYLLIDCCDFCLNLC